jgi:hypothetical protein
MKLDIITLIKCLAIIYISILYTFTGITISNVLETYFFPKLFKTKLDEDTQDIFKLTFEIAIIFGILGIFSFFGRNLVEYIPFPFDKHHGFDYSRVQNLTSSLVFTVSTMTCTLLTDRVTLLKNKFTNK